jgi:hemerythrin-like domain-containing protein
MALRSIDILVSEHRAVEKAITELEGLIDEFLVNSEVPGVSKQALGEIADYLSRHLLLHIEKENQALFPVLEKFLSPEAGPLTVMLDEHLQIARSFCGLRGGVLELDQHPATGGPAAARIRDHGRTLIYELRNHLLKEERVLFPFAEGHMSEEDDRWIVERFEEIVSNTPDCEHARLKT